jgi:hypothetical protein
MRVLTTSLFALVAPLAPVAAQAIVAQSSGLAFPARVIDFGAGLFPDGTPVATQFAGLVITHASYFTAPAANNHVVGGFLGNDPAAGQPDTLRIRFAQSVGDVSFVYHQLGTGTSTIRALRQGLVVDSFPIAWNATQPNTFFGFLETALDELQIDFVGDFRLDELAFNPVGGAACFYYNGNNVNPASFGCLTLPVLGATWQGQVWNLPNTILTAIVWAPAGLGTPVPQFGGEMLLNPAQPLVGLLGAQNYSLAIPAEASWVGTTLVFQGVRLDLVSGVPAVVPLNAVMLMLGL